MQHLSILNSYAGGDLISILPGLQHVYNTTGKKWIIYQKVDCELYYYEGMIPSITNELGKPVSCNQKHFNMLKPLLMCQEYIEDFIIWKGEKCNIDMDKSRDSRSIPMPYVPLNQLPFLIAPQLQCDLSIPWIKLPNSNVHFFDKVKDKVLINRTQRYTNPNINYFFLKQYEKDLLFIGTLDEYECFNKQWDLNLEYLQLNDFQEVAIAINQCKFLLGNQSLCWHIADSISKNRILEVCSVFPNTWPNTPNGKTFLFQESAEVLFYNMFNKI